MTPIKGSDSFNQLLSAALEAPKGSELKSLEAFVTYCETHVASLSAHWPSEGYQKLQSRLTQLKSPELQNLVQRMNAVTRNLAATSKRDPTNFAQQSPDEQVKTFQNFSTLTEMVRWLEVNSKTKRIALDISHWKEAKAWKRATLSTGLRAHDFQHLFTVFQALSEEGDYVKLGQELARAYMEQASDDNLRMFLTGLSSQERAKFFQLTGKEPFHRRTLSLQFCDWAFGKENDFGLLLSRLPHLQNLDLSGCQKVTDACLREVPQCRYLKVLKLAYLPGLTGSGLSHLLPLREMLTELRLNKCDNLDKKQLEQLEGFNRLETLDLSQLRLEDQDLNFIARLMSLRSVNLSKNSALTDDVFKRFAALENLETVILKNNPQITGRGFSEVSRLKKLRHLDFEECRQLQDASLAAISGMAILESLNLNLCSSLTGAALNHLRGLENLRTLQCRQWSRFTVDEMKILGHLKLRLLDLSANPGLTSSHITSLAGMRSLQILQLEGCSQLDNSALEILSSLKDALLEVHLSGCIKISDLSRFQGLAHLVRLNLAGTGITGSLQPLSLLKQLRELDLSGCAIDTPGLAPLVSLPHLSSLILKSCIGLTADSLDLIKRMPAIQTVELFGCEEVIPYQKVEESGLTSVVHISEKN